MNKKIYKIGTIAATVALAIAPAVALADTNDGGQAGIQLHAKVTSSLLGTRASSTVSENGSASDEDAGSVHTASQNETHASSSNDGMMEASSSEHRGRDNDYKNGPRVDISSIIRADMASSTVRAMTLVQLKQIIAVRKTELAQQEASSSPEESAVLKNANPTRLAVHTLLASKILLGGIGTKVSVIAQEMNDSVATTTEAQTQIESRGFFARLFFGGDQKAAATITTAVQKNQQHIDELTTLLNDANISADLKVTLQTQITALEASQVKLQALAQKEQGTWGLVSWRF